MNRNELETPFFLAKRKNWRDQKKGEYTHETEIDTRPVHECARRSFCRRATRDRFYEKLRGKLGVKNLPDDSILSLKPPRERGHCGCAQWS